MIMTKPKQTNKPTIKKKIISTTIVAPVAKATKVTMAQPIYRTLNNGNIVVRHSEYISDIFGSVDFNATKFIVQPGISQTFPWLSLMAPLYESYHMRNLKFSFLTQKSTLTNGTVMMALDYDAQDEAPVAKTFIMAYANAVRTAPWSDCCFTASSQAMNKFPERYIRSGTTVGDIKTFDIGNFFVATQGNADTSALGELHVSYEIEFRTPQLDAAVFASLGSSSNNATVGITGSLLLGTSPNVNVSPSGLNFSYNTSTGTYTFGSPGTYLIVINVTSGALAPGTAVVTLTGGSTVSAIDQGGTSLLLLTFTVRILNGTDVMTISGLTLPLATFTRLRVASYPFGL